MHGSAKELLIEDGRCVGVRTSDGKNHRAAHVLVTTGGTSYPATGSDGSGYKLARQAGHTVVPPEPSLVSLVERGGVCRRMMGLSLKNVALTLYEGKKALFCEQGEMLFTHFGVSGPVVLSASAYLRGRYPCNLYIDLKPALTADALDRRLLRDFKMTTYNEVTGRGFLRHVLVKRGFQTGEVMVVLVTGTPIFPARNNFTRALLKLHPEITTIIQNVNDRYTSMLLGQNEKTLYGPGYITDILCGLRFRISAKSFYQINPVQTEVLYGKAMEFAEFTGKETVIDAYCGIGTIGMVAAKKAGQIHPFPGQRPFSAQMRRRL